MANKKSDSTTQELRDAITAVKRGRSNVHVPIDLRRRAVQVLRDDARLGIPRTQTAAALGIHPITLANWQRALAKESPFVQACLVEPSLAPSVGATESRPSIRVLCIDGLDIPSLEALLRRLA